MSEARKNDDSGSDTCNELEVREERETENCASISGSNYFPGIFIHHVENLHRGDITNYPPEIAASNHSIEDAVAILKQKLRKIYERVTLPCVSWMEEGVDFELSKYYVELQLKSETTSLEIEEIFGDVSGKKPTRILVEAQPGFGKTTLASKIVYDWATEKSYLREFDLAFLIPLRELDGNSVRQILDACVEELEVGITGQISEIITKNGIKTLIVLDGLDEVSEIGNNDVEKILYGQLYHDVTVIATCRSGCFTEKSRKICGVSTTSKFYDKKIDVFGIVEKNRELFLKNFVEENRENVFRRVWSLHLLDRKLFQSPLLLILLSYIAVKDEDLIKLTTQENVYKALVDFAIRRSCEVRSGLILDEKFSIFECPNSEYGITFCQFGELCLDKIAKQDLQFECDELTRKIYELGFLARHKKKISFKTTEKYEAFHLSLMEFAAGFAIQCELCNSCDLRDKTIQLLLKLTLKYHSAVLNILIGLLDEKAVELFQQLVPHAYKFSTDDNNARSLLQNHKYSNPLSLITKFIPPYIVFSTFMFYHDVESSRFNDIYEACARHVQNFTISCGFKISRNLPSVVTPCIEISASWGDNLDQLEQMVCKDLRLTVGRDEIYEICEINEVDEIEKRENDQLLFTFCKMQAEKKSIVFNAFYDFNTAALPPLSLTKLMLPLELSRGIDVQGENCFLRRIVEKCDAIQSLDIKVISNPSQDEANNFLRFCSKLSQVESLKINISTISSTVNVDLDILTDGGEKQWKTLIVNASNVSCGGSLKKSNCLRNLILEESDLQDVSTVCSQHLRILRCKASVFHCLNRPTNTCTQNITELMIILNSVNDCEEFWLSIASLKNLTMLGIVIPFPSTIIKRQTSAIVRCLQSLPINRFAVSYLDQNDFDDDLDYLSAFRFTEDLLKDILNSYDLCTRQIAIDLIMPDEYNLLFSRVCYEQFAESVQEIIVLITECLKRNILNIVNIVGDPEVLRIICDVDIDCKIFKVEHSRYSFGDGDPELFKILLEDFLMYFTFQLAICKREQ